MGEASGLLNKVNHLYVLKMSISKQLVTWRTALAPLALFPS